MNILKQIGVALVLSAIATGFSESAYAYDYRTCGGKAIKWNGGQTRMYITFPSGGIWDSVFQRAMKHWTDVKGSRFKYYVGHRSDGKHKSGNGKNEVYWTSSLANSTLGVTKSRWHCYWAFGYHRGLDETDIQFNANRPWSTASLDYLNLGSPFRFEGVAVHELGHALGLNHENRVIATMNAGYPAGGTLGLWKQWDVLGNDRLGIRKLYPDSTVEADIASSIFRVKACGKTDVVAYPTSASRGSRIKVNYSFSNLGTSKKTFNIGFYLSKDIWFTQSDILLATNYGALAGPGYTATLSRYVTVPNWITPGDYYLGFVVDKDGTTYEHNEWNNFIAMPEKININ